MMNDKMIEKFENAGFRRWTKYGNDRLYIDAEGLGLSYSRRNSGSIAYAEWQGEKISNNHARDMIACKMYIDVTTGEAHFSGDSKYIEDAFNAKIEELMQDEAENETEAETENNNETNGENGENNEMEDTTMRKIEMTARGLWHSFDFGGESGKMNWNYTVERRDRYDEGDNAGDIYITSEDGGNGDFMHASKLEDGTNVYVECHSEWGDLNDYGYVYREMVDGTVWFEDEQTICILERPINHPERIINSDKYDYFRQRNGAELPEAIEDNTNWYYRSVIEKLGI